MRTLATALFTCLALTVQHADAQPPIPEMPANAAEREAQEQEARALYSLGADAYSGGAYQRALGRFIEAYSLTGRVAFLVNIALCQERLRQDTDALASYRAYLERTGENPPRARFVRSRIAFFESSLEEDAGPGVLGADTVAGSGASEQQGGDLSESQQSVEVAGTDPGLQDEYRSTGGPGPGPWVMVGAGAAVAGVGVALFLVGTGRRDRVEEAPRGSAWGDYEGDSSAARRLGGAGQTLIGIGAAAAIGGVIWAIVSSGSDEDDVALAGAQHRVSVGPSSAHYTLTF